MSYRAPMSGLGQAKPSVDHTGADVATAFQIGTPLITSIIGAATGQQQATATTTPAATLTAQAAPPSSTDWYWPALGAVGVLAVGGILYMVTKKPAAKAAPAAAKPTANRRRSRKNGWRRKAARSLKGKRRSRSKR